MGESQWITDDRMGKIERCNIQYQKNIQISMSKKNITLFLGILAFVI